MTILARGAIAALFMGMCMGATLKPATPVTAHTEQAPRLTVEPADNGLLASAERIAHSAG